MARLFFLLLSMFLATPGAISERNGDPQQIPLGNPKIEDLAEAPTPTNNIDTPTRAGDQLARMPTPVFPWGFTQCNCDGMECRINQSNNPNVKPAGDIYTRGNLNAVIINGAMATPIPTIYT